MFRPAENASKKSILVEEMPEIPRNAGGGKRALAPDSGDYRTAQRGREIAARVSDLPPLLRTREHKMVHAAHSKALLTLSAAPRRLLPLCDSFAAAATDVLYRRRGALPRGDGALICALGRVAACKFARISAPVPIATTCSLPRRLWRRQQRLFLRPLSNGSV